MRAAVDTAQAWAPVQTATAERLHVLLSVRPRTTTDLVRVSGCSLLEVLDVLRDGLTTGEIVEVPGLRYVLDDVWEGPQ